MTDEQFDRRVRDADPYRPEVIAHLGGAEAGTPGGDHVHADPRIRHRASGPALPPAPHA